MPPTGIFCILALAAVSTAQTVPSFSAGVVVGRIDDTELDEASSLAASRKFPGILYTHNDHGDVARLFAINASTAMVEAVLNISPATHHDWEAMEVGPCGPNDMNSCIYILDDGEYRNEDSRTIYKLPEPDTMMSQTLAPQAVLYYNWTEHGADTLMIDPDAKLYIISTILGGRGMIITVDPAFFGNDINNPVFLDSGDYFSIESTHHDPSDGSISVDGQEILVKIREEIYYWATPKDGDISAALTHKGVQVPYTVERLGEGICWAADGSAYYTLGEGTHAPLYRYDRVNTGVVG
ncbi:uncharacterized protein LOC128228980 [Mya arenaria]|uniref:uncharacterized protein LOC128228980 n=1 Tax=Mya arenaria TaxID=6604 RepID=UPI0022E33621|nr:uncharacterized protein LOC128228980 [Mya arenaria]